ncbi:hypothetical protein KJ758_00360 [Patescibacteria group bacterium]|nr:hypothetical protein [Patescibacteria group bacterium]
MSEIYVKSAEFVSTPDESQPLLKTVLLPLPQNRGSLFALIRILGTKDEKKTRIKDVIEDHLKRLQNTLGDQVNVPRRFEQVLQAVNEDISRISFEGKKIPMTDFHVVIGILHKNQIFFSGVGSLFTLFMHKTAKQRYVLYELSDQYRSGDGPSWDKPFVTVLDGELAQGDIFYIASRVSAREISIADLQDTLVTLPPSGALKRIQQHLHTDTAYGALCFHVEDSQVSGAPKKVNPLSSIEHLEKTQDDTANLLGEQSPDVSSLLNRIASPILKQLSAPGTHGFKKTMKNILRALIKIIIAIAIVAYKGLAAIAKSITRLAKLIFHLVRDPAKRNAIKGTARQISQKLKESIRNIPKVAKLSALAVFALLIILSISLSLNAKQKEKQDTNQTFDTIVSRVSENTDAASASLIYNDSNQARQLLEEALALLETLPPSHKKYQETNKQLKEEIDAIYSELRGIEEVEITAVVDLASIDQQERFRNFVDVDGVIYGISEQAILYRYSELEGQLIKEESSFGAIGDIIKSSQYPGGFVFLDSNQRIGKANTVTNTLNPVVSGSESLQSAEDIKAYNNNIYLLSAVAQQIVRMQPRGDGFDAGTAWITSRNTDISSARSFTIDGDIYILTATGVVKFTSGIEQNFSISAIDPALQTPTIIQTSLGSSYLYILDPGASRVIVVDKNGAFVTQYSNASFQDSIQLFINENKKTITVGTPTQLLQFTATHLLQ